MRTNKLLLGSIVFSLISFFIHPLSGSDEVVPFYSWDLYTSVNKNLSFYRLTINDEVYSDLLYEEDGLRRDKKYLLKRLATFSRESVLEALRNDFHFRSGNIKLEKKYINTLEYYKTKNIQRSVLVWKYSL